jgi:probable F420-dependent oxidoreductase
MTKKSILKKRGVWHPTDAMSASESEEFAQRIDELGYSFLWIPETTGRDPFAHIAYLASGTENLHFATGIANIYHRLPGVTRQAAATLAEQSGGRFLLGLGISHAPLVEGLRQIPYEKPIATMRGYLQSLKTSPYTSVPPAQEPKCVIAALGPQMLKLSSDFADGAHPYWTTPDHTYQAKDILGNDKILCVEQKVVLTQNKETAYSAAKSALRIYTSLPNYRNSWKRLGFSETDIDSASDRFIDSVVAWGSIEQIEKRIKEHEQAGASHVCIQVLPHDGNFKIPEWETFEALAP